MTLYPLEEQRRAPAVLRWIAAGLLMAAAHAGAGWWILTHPISEAAPPDAPQGITIDLEPIAVPQNAPEPTDTMASGAISAPQSAAAADVRPEAPTELAAAQPDAVAPPAIEPPSPEPPPPQAPPSPEPQPPPPPPETPPPQSPPETPPQPQPEAAPPNVPPAIEPPPPEPQPPQAAPPEPAPPEPPPPAPPPEPVPAPVDAKPVAVPAQEATPVTPPFAESAGDAVLAPPPPPPPPPLPRPLPTPKPRPPAPKPQPPKPDPRQLAREAAERTEIAERRAQQRAARAEARAQARAADAREAGGQAPQAAAPSSASSGAAIASWRGEVKAHLDAYRPSSPNGASGTARIAFSVDRSGRVLSASVAGSSGDGALDEAAVAMVRRASPVPAPPPELGGRVSLVAPVRFR